MLLAAQTQQLPGTSRSVTRRGKKKRSVETAERIPLVWREKERAAEIN